MAELKLTDEQLDRLDAVQDYAGDFLKALAETDDITFDIDDLWNLIYLGCELLHKRGREVRLPTGTRGMKPVADLEHQGAGRNL